MSTFVLSAEVVTKVISDVSVTSYDVSCLAPAAGVCSARNLIGQSSDR